MTITDDMVDRAAAERWAGIVRAERAAGVDPQHHPLWSDLCASCPDAVAGFREEARRMLEAALNR